MPAARSTLASPTRSSLRHSVKKRGRSRFSRLLSVVTDLVQAIAVGVSALVYVASMRFLLALALGTAVLLSENWVMSMMVRF